MRLLIAAIRVTKARILSYGNFSHSALYVRLVHSIIYGAFYSFVISILNSIQTPLIAFISGELLIYSSSGIPSFYSLRYVYLLAYEGALSC
jgi:hypothetical protein